jgi:hypothetical protein
MESLPKTETKRKPTAQQKLNNFLRSELALSYNLDGYTKATLAALASYFWYSDTCYPSLKHLINYSGFSDKQIKRSLIILEKYDLIKIDRKRGRHNIYHWNVPLIEDKEVYKRVDK